jgi:hypothetical protein
MSKKTIPSLRGRGGYKSNAPGSPKKGKKEGGKGRILLSRLIPLGVVLLLAAVGGAALALLRTQPVWYVAEEYAAAWADILDSTKAPFSRVKPYPGEGKIPKNRYGYIITGTLEGRGFSGAGDPASEIPLRIYPGLSRSREYRGALALALNPWMVFRKYQDPDLIRSRIDAAGGEPGRLLLPGGDIRAAWAWMAQLLQNPPGTFPPRGEEWDPARLFRSHRFQQGAATYTWEDAWASFFMDDLSCIYAPLQWVREFPP